jgi:hypothetical protein
MTEEKHIDDNLGPLQPHKKTCKAAKVVLASLVAAAGVAAGTAIMATNGCYAGLAGLPPCQNITTKPATTTQPAKTTVSAKRQVLPGDMAAPASLKSETQPVER